MSTYPASIVEAVVHHSERTPDTICLRFEGTAITYALLRSRIEAFARALHTWGLRGGDRTALFMGNSPEFLAAYLGTHLAGGVVVLVNPQYRQVELRHILHDAGVRICFTEPQLHHEIDRVQSDLPHLQAIIETGPVLDTFLMAGSPYEFTFPHGEAIAAIAYTSGTTGRSKGAVLLHRNQIANIRAVCQAWHWTRNDQLLLTLPLFHVHGLMVGVHGTLYTGASVDLRRSFNAAEVYDTLLAGDVTMFFGVPTMYARLVAEATSRTERLHPIRLFVSGSAALSAETFDQFEQRFGQRILERYGMTETLMNLTNPYHGERRAGTVGMPFPGQEARVVDKGTRRPLPPDTDGEIEVRGPHVCASYWNRPDATAERFMGDGWFRTGDLGRVSVDGYYTITGRATDLIISGGYNVYPREVEELLQQCPGVHDVAVVGLPDPDLGEQVVAVIVRNDPGVGEEQIVSFCRQHLASYKKPRRVLFVDALPRNALGKVQKHMLREALQGDARSRTDGSKA
jgi:malonyl-CoA/methylmalonyl-CoA synthetase